MSKTILFLGATGGVGLSALRRALSAGHTCIALCRTPSNLTSQLPAELVPSEAPNNTSNLHIITGNAHDPAALTRCFSAVPASPIDTIVFSIGARPTLRGMSDPHVCEKGMGMLLDVLRTQRDSNTQRDNTQEGGTSYQPPRLIAISTTGISTVARDIPLAMVPLYKVVLHTAHEDKRAMERLVVAAGTSPLSSEKGRRTGAGTGTGTKGEGLVRFTLVRGSLYTSGPETDGPVRVGVENVGRGVVERKAVGYTISREDVGKWVWEECIMREGGEWVGKAVGVTY